MAITTVTSPMVGKILQVPAQVGEKVQEDDTIIVLEAMKMEIPVVAPAGGTIREIKVAPGDMVEADAILALIEE
jgi:acetyl-CoA carboxylase biotin carboxyl carrier protein